MSASRTSQTDIPGEIAPPPLVFAGFLFAGAIADRHLVGAQFGIPDVSRYVVVAALILSALFFLVGALGGFRRARTRAEPWKPTTAVVTGGVYRFTRNPMYVGMALAYSGFAFGMDNVLALLLLVPAVFVIQHGVILREERYLEAKFGAEYVQYKSRVRRWF